MVKTIITYQNQDKDWLEYFTYIKYAELLHYHVVSGNEDTEDHTLNEVCTSKEQIIELRDFLNSLDLGDK